jgi:hypothetical protein
MVLRNTECVRERERERERKKERKKERSVNITMFSLRRRVGGGGMK